MSFKTILYLSRVLPYRVASEKQIEAIHKKNYKLAHIYNCCTWLQLFKSREGPRKIQAWKYAMASYRFQKNTPMSL